MVKEFTALDEAEEVVHDGKVLLRKIKIKVHRAGAPELYLQVFNDATITLGTTAPNEVIRIPAYDTMNPLYEHTIIFAGPRGGVEYSAALTLAVTTTHDGLTGPDAGEEPYVRVDYQPVG